MTLDSLIKNVALSGAEGFCDQEYRTCSRNDDYGTPVSGNCTPSRDMVERPSPLCDGTGAVWGDGFRVKSGSKKLMKVRSLLHRSAGCFRTFALRPVWPWKRRSAQRKYSIQTGF